MSSLLVPAATIGHTMASLCTRKSITTGASFIARAFSIVLSTVIFGHAIKPLMGLGAVIVFATIFNRIKRQAAKRKQAAPAVAGGK